MTTLQRNPRGVVFHLPMREPKIDKCDTAIANYIDLNRISPVNVYTYDNSRIFNEDSREKVVSYLFESKAHKANKIEKKPEVHKEKPKIDVVKEKRKESLEKVVKRPYKHSLKRTYKKTNSPVPHKQVHSPMPKLDYFKMKSLDRREERLKKELQQQNKKDQQRTREKLQNLLKKNNLLRSTIIKHKMSLNLNSSNKYYVNSLKQNIIKNPDLSNKDRIQVIEEENWRLQKEANDLKQNIQKKRLIDNVLNRQDRELSPKPLQTNEKHTYPINHYLQKFCNNTNYRSNRAINVARKTPERQSVTRYILKNEA